MHPFQLAAFGRARTDRGRMRLDGDIYYASASPSTRLFRLCVPALEVLALSEI